MTDDFDLAGLLCSRLCHDLISPVGAIGNGLELLRADPVGGREELDLIEDSARAAQAALSFFRLAFGAASHDGRDLSIDEMGRVAGAYFGPSRHRLEWPAAGDPLPRPAAKALMLLLLAGVSATPLGGRLAPSAPENWPLSLSLVAEGRRAGLDDGARALLAGASSAAQPRDAHLVVLARTAKTLGRRVSVAVDGERVTLGLAD
jgi:histidine phosphotransferase ChpT